MRKITGAIIIAGTLLAGCASPTTAPTVPPSQAAVEPTPIRVPTAPAPTATPTSSAIPSPTPTMRPAQEGCVRATTEIPEGQNPTRFVTSGPGSGCYDSVGEFLDDVALTWGEFAPGTAITFWTQCPVNASGQVMYPAPTATLPPTATPIPTAAPAAVAVLEWPFDIHTPIAGINYMDLDQISFDTQPTWNDNGHVLTHNCIDYTFDVPAGGDMFTFRTDPETGNLVGITDDHGGVDLFVPLGTQFLSRWDTQLIVENERLVKILFNGDNLRLYIGHVRPAFPLVRDNRYQITSGQVIATMERGLGGMYTHPSTGLEYAEVHIEVEIKDPTMPSGFRVVGFNPGPCDPDPPMTFNIPVEQLNFINRFPGNPYQQ